MEKAPYHNGLRNSHAGQKTDDIAVVLLRPLVHKFFKKNSRRTDTSEGVEQIARIPIGDGDSVRRARHHR